MTILLMKTAKDINEYIANAPKEMRSGYFKSGKQTGEWITYEKKDDVYKKTLMKEELRLALTEYLV